MTPIEQAKASLVRMQEFDADELVRRDALGERLNFGEVVVPAKRLISFYRQLAPETVDDFPSQMAETLRQYADADYQRFSQILAFDPQKEGTPAQRSQFIQQIRDTYESTFTGLYPLISYGMTKAVDFRRIENEARATIQSVVDSAGESAEELTKAKEEAGRILAEVRKVAAEHGVTQQSIYFKEEAERHDVEAKKWQTATIRLAIGLGAIAFLSLWLHLIPGLDADLPLRALQIGTSKVLIFVVIGYCLLLAAKNFLAHRHNSVVNRHRQNALLTFKALVDAAKGEEAKDIILAHAASCIFAPQETAYSKSAAGSALSKAVIELLPGTVGRNNN